MVSPSWTPEGPSNRCPVCGDLLEAGPVAPAGAAPCSRCGHLLWFTWKELGDEWALRPTGDLQDAEALGRLVELLPMRPGMRIVMDFSEVRYLRSSILAVLIKLKKKAEAAGASVRLRALHPDLREVFRICRLDQAFDMEA